MMTNTLNTPYIRTAKKSWERGLDWSIALIPVLIWSVYMFGARVLTLCLISAVFALALDFPVQKFIFKRDISVSFQPEAPTFAVLSVFMMPVTVPLWIPMVSAVLVVVAKNITWFRNKRIFNPFVFSAAVLNLSFPSLMTAFTRPFAYFSAFTFTLDQKLVEGYRVLTPLQYTADGSVYEDGVLAQFYGFASGNIGEIAVCAMLIALVWLSLRGIGSPVATVAFLVPVFLLAMTYASEDAESNFYAYSMLLTGGIIFLSIFVFCESGSVPLTGLGKMIFALVCGVLIFLARKFYGGYEWSYAIVLAMNLFTPVLEVITKPKPVGNKKWS